MKHQKTPQNNPETRSVPRNITISEDQELQLRAYESELRRLNERVNLVSRSTDDEIWNRHIAHCLTLGMRSFPEGVTIIDWGCGGGLPAIPLSILNPRAQVVGVDAVRKKILAARAMSRRLELDNCTFWHGRAESYPRKAAYSVSRATAPLAQLWTWHQAISRPPEASVDEGATAGSGSIWRPGLICLKGGDLDEEIREACRAFPKLEVEKIDLADSTDRRLFQDKYIISLTAE